MLPISTRKSSHGRDELGPKTNEKMEESQQIVSHPLPLWAVLRHMAYTTFLKMFKDEQPAAFCKKPWPVQ